MNEMFGAGTDPLALDQDFSKLASSALRDSAEKLKSLNQALMWERHKYRAKQHVLRVSQVGFESPACMRMCHL